MSARQKGECWTLNTVKVPSFSSVQTAAIGTGSQGWTTWGLGFLVKEDRKALAKKWSQSHGLGQNEP